MLEHYNIDIVKTLTVGDYPPPAMLVKLIDELPVGSRYVAKKLGDNRFLGRTRDTVVLEDTYDLIQALLRTCGESLRACLCASWSHGASLWGLLSGKKLISTTSSCHYVLGKVAVLVAFPFFCCVGW